MTPSQLDSAQLRSWLADLFPLPEFSRLSLTQPAPEAASQKVIGRRILLKDRPALQLAYRIGTKEHHKNFDPGSAADEVTRLLESQFHRLQLFTGEADYSLKRLASGKFQSLRTKPSQSAPVVEETHNRGKQYLIPEGTPVPFLIEMGVMNAQGKVLAAKAHKFRQINRFLEMVDDIVPRLPQDRPLRVVDFGAGKSYLTFAVHHLLTTLRGLSVQTTALDRNAQVIEHCRQTAERLGCTGLHFHSGEIRDFLPAGEIDLVISLHACDTATDDVLAQAVQGRVPVILSAPCCQHELAPQLNNPALAGLLRHGLMRERFGAMLTDALRAAALEVCGYQTQLLEFIDLEHTPKNLLIRAIRREHPEQGRDEKLAQYQSLRTAAGIHTFHLEQILNTAHAWPP